MPSTNLFEDFLTFFRDKISDLRLSPLTIVDPVAPSVYHAAFECFEPVSLSEPTKTVKQLKLLLRAHRTLFQVVCL